MTTLSTMFYADAMRDGLRIIHLLPSSERCPAGTWEDHVITTPEEAASLLEEGENVGFLLAGKGGDHPNPLGIWALVIRSQETLELFGDRPFTLMLSWGDPHKRILLGRLPDPSVPRKSRLVKGSHDVKLAGVIPTLGSVHPEGGTIQVHTRDLESGSWKPWDGNPIKWESLAVVDPAPYTPSTVMLIPLDEQRASEAATRVPPEWIIWHEDVPKEWNRQAYTTAKGTLSSRKIRGEGFIRNRIRYGIVSRCGEDGRRTLLAIAVHLVQYLRLPDEMTLALLAEPVYGMKVAWNDLCADAKSKAPMPWDLEELQGAIAAAHEYVPPYGVFEYQRQKTLRDALERLQAFRKLLSLLPVPSEGSPSMGAAELYETFLEMYGVERKDMTYHRFALAIQSGIATGYLKLKNIRRTRKKLRYYLGVSPESIDFALELSALAKAS